MLTKLIYNNSNSTTEYSNLLFSLTTRTNVHSKVGVSPVSHKFNPRERKFWYQINGTVFHVRPSDDSIPVTNLLHFKYSNAADVLRRVLQRKTICDTCSRDIVQRFCCRINSNVFWRTRWLTKTGLILLMPVLITSIS